MRIKRREPNGRLQRKPLPEREAQIIELALYNRRKHDGVPVGAERSQLAGSVFGRVYLAGIISGLQYDTGTRWGKLARSYGRVLAAPPYSPKAQALGQVIQASHDGEFDSMTPEAIAWTRVRYDEMHKALIEAKEGREYLAALRRVILEDRYGNIGHLREALNLLAHLWK